VRLIRSEDGLWIEFLSLPEQYEAYARQRDAEEHGQPVEQLFTPHSRGCRERARQQPQPSRRPTGRGRRRTHR
jgi:hypothetical protein